jgi:gas vesicle protein
MATAHPVATDDVNEGSAMAKERHTVAFVLGAAIGGAIGAVFGLLNAPRPGTEARADLTERWHDVEERTAEGIANLESDVRERIAPEWAPGSEAR